MFIGQDFTTGDFLSRVPGRLGLEIIGQGMNDNGVPDGFFRHKSACIEHGQCIAAASEQRRHISCVGRMGTSIRVPVLSSIGKRILLVRIRIAIGTFMDMKAVNVNTAGTRILGQCLDFRQEKRTAPAGVEVYDSPDIWISRTSPDDGICFRRRLGQFAQNLS